MIKSDSLKALAPALVAAQKKMGAALKDSKNPFFKSKYADLNAVIDATVPVFNEEGIAVLQTPQIVDGKPVIQTLLIHESGEYLGSNTEVVAAKQNDPQAAGSAISYARRYGLQATTTCKAEDDDGEGAMGRKESTPVKVEQKQEVKAEQSTQQVETKPAASPKASWGAKKSTPAPAAKGDLY